MSLTLHKIEVTSMSGKDEPATLVRCECGVATFIIYYTLGMHEHWQCTACGASYCDGSCRGGIN